ncbi:MAG: hypothetical protein PHF84_04155 [bacterium]|nr:hypothetical protein [bacterium]
MAEKISKVKKIEYAEKSTELKKQIDELNKHIQEMLKSLSSSGALINYKKVIIANLYMNIIMLYIKLSNLSMDILGIKNESYLENARKLSYKFISILEDIVGNYVDVPYSEMKDKLATISQLDDIKRLKLVKKISYSVSMMEEAFGPNSKWKWSFVDLDARAANLCKNLTDYKRIQENQDPRVEGFPERNELLKFIKIYIRKAADRLREKYEIANPDVIILKEAIKYLAALMRIAITFNDGDEANNLKKNIKIWEEKLEQDEKKLDEEKKKKLKK